MKKTGYKMPCISVRIFTKDFTVHIPMCKITFFTLSKDVCRIIKKMFSQRVGAKYITATGRINALVAVMYIAPTSSPISLWLKRGKKLLLFTL